MAGIEQMDTVTNSTEPSSARRQIEAYLSAKGMLASNPRFGASVSQLLDANMRDPSILPNIVGAPEPMSTPRGDRGGDGGSRNAPPSVGRSAPSGGSVARDVEGSNPTIPPKGGASTGAEPNAAPDQRSSASNAASEPTTSAAISRAVDEPAPARVPPASDQTPPTPSDTSAPPTSAPPTASSGTNWPAAAGAGLATLAGGGGLAYLARQILGGGGVSTPPPVQIGLPSAPTAPLPPGTVPPTAANPISAVPIGSAPPMPPRPTPPIAFGPPTPPGASVPGVPFGPPAPPTPMGPMPMQGPPPPPMGPPPPPGGDPLQSALERAVPSEPPPQMFPSRDRPMQPGPTESSPRLRGAAPASDPQRLATVGKQVMPGASADDIVNLIASIRGARGRPPRVGGRMVP